MKKLVLRKTSNPKKAEEYLKMFDKYLKYVKEIHHPSSFIVDEPASTIKDVVIDSMTLGKNDRIESFLKYYRACLCQRVIVHYEGTDADEFRKYCEKEISTYKQKTEFLLGEVLPDSLEIQWILTQLIHFIDLYNSDKNFWRVIGEYSWANKTFSKINSDLSSLEEELRGRKDFSIKEYERKLADAENTLEYLKIDDKYTWYIVESNSCRFEAYLNQHCGTDSSADVLFSLRSKDKQGYFDSHVTISASIAKIDKNKFGIPAVFVVKQVKGKGNTKPNERYWSAIIQLFKEDEFGWQQIGSYRPESDFHISDLSEFEKKNFLKLKPWWDNIILALRHYDKFKDTKAFTAKYWGAKDAIFDDQGTFIITYHSFHEMIDMLDKEWGAAQKSDRGRRSRSDNIITQAKYFIEEFYPDADFSWRDIWFDDFMLWIKNKEKKKYNKINECLEAEGMSEIKELGEYDFDTFEIVGEGCQSYLFQVKNAFELAYRTGLAVGEQSAAYEAFKNYFDDHEMTYNGGHMGNFKLNSDGTFQVRIFQEAINEYYEEVGELGIPDPDADSLEVPNRGIDWSGDFDDEAASERLFEELPD
jgi:hypothetical protein